MSPPLRENNMLLLPTVAASLLKLGVDASERQFFVPAPVLAVQVMPLSIDTYTKPALIAAAILLKSGEAVTPFQLPAIGVDIVAILDGYDPAGTGAHTELPVVLVKDPATQGEQAKFPEELLKVPAAHAVHPLVLGVTTVP